MAEIYIPNYMSFHNDNTFLGSYEGLRFKLTPDVEGETILAEYWYGPLSYENSQMDGEKTFPLTDQGILDMKNELLALSAAGKDGGKQA